MRIRPANGTGSPTVIARRYSSVIGAESPRSAGGDIARSLPSTAIPNRRESRTRILYTIFVYKSPVGDSTMKNITLSADEKLIAAARARAQAEHTTLNE